MQPLEADAGPSLRQTVRYFDLEAAEEDGALALIGSVYDVENDRVTDDLSRHGPRVITFNNVLRHGAVPLAQALTRLLELTSEGLGGHVEIEFAYPGDPQSRTSHPNGGDPRPALYVLQVRPMATHFPGDVTLREPERDRILCASEHALGHGVHDEICDVIYVRRDRWEARWNRKIAEEIGQLNERLRKEGRSYVLIGPGRWGTADEWLGIPVDWAQISNVRVLVEASPPGYRVEPSQGTHFFQNMTSLRLGYLTVPPRTVRAGEEPDELVDWEWLDRQSSHAETEHLRLVRLTQPLTILLDGRERRGLIVKPKEE
jgi:hypothetical protein